MIATVPPKPARRPASSPSCSPATRRSPNARTTRRLRSGITAVIAGARTARSDERAVETAVLQAVHELHCGAIHRATLEYPEASEDRRRVAAELGERAERMTAALIAAGWTHEQAER